MSAGPSFLAGFPIVLASGSPRRIEILRAQGIEAILRPADVDETVPEGMNARQAVMYLALKKALAAAEAYGPFADEGRAGAPPLVLAADTMVRKDGAGVFGKPGSRAEAHRMLDALRNGAHTVHTGVAVLCGALAPARGGTAKRRAIPAPKRVFCEEARVFFKDYPQSAIEAYIASGEPFDKAGGYAVQGGFGVHVDRIEGDVRTVMGLPWERTERELAAMVAAVQTAG
jgi:septum formation protein